MRRKPSNIYATRLDMTMSFTTLTTRKTRYSRRRYDHNNNVHDDDQNGDDDVANSEAKQHVK